jgi:hypothetical protein
MLATRDFRRDGEIARHEMTFAPRPGEPGLQTATVSLDVWRRREAQAVTGAGTITLITDASFATLDLDVATRLATIAGDGGASSPQAPVSRESFDELARAAGLDPLEKRTHRQMDALSAQFEGIFTKALGKGSWSASATADVFSSMSGGSSSAGVPAGPPNRWKLTGASALWLGGVALGLLRRRRVSTPLSPDGLAGAPGGGA